MSQNLLFDIKIPEGHVVQFEQESTFENFIGQFQLFCPKLLCVVDGSCLRYYDKPGTIPTNIRFDYKQRRGKLTEYYFRDIGNDSLYCVFSREAAKIFYPRIDEVDPIDIRGQVNESITHPSNSSVNATTVRENNGSNTIISKTTNTKELFEAFKPLTGQNKELNCKLPYGDPRLAIVSPSHSSSCNDLVPNQVNNPDVNTVHNYGINAIVSRSRPTVIPPTNYIGGTTRIPEVSQLQSNNEKGRTTNGTSQGVKRHIIQPIIQPTVKKDVQANERIICDTRRTNLTTRQDNSSHIDSNPKVVTRVVSNRSHPPDQVVIIDKGVKFIFPNSNYPIEVRTHYPR